ncbi:hypothetical protein [Acinetobacter baumannii]|uniref:hypothetical protein n=1 Tax=Acinetobacter baumannii TaxID=470 RepID=UPI001EFB0D31|nr:hypothetical protein [Acinetobacter baumannii]
MNLKQWQRSKKIKAEAEAAAKRTVERVLNAVKEPAMSEFKEPKIGDKIIIPEGFILVGFDGDYKKVYEVVDYFFDNKHGMPFITFEANGKHYTFTPCAVDKASTAEISAGFREGTKEFEKYWYGRSEAEEVKAMELLNDMGDDSHIENHIGPLCKSKDV